MADNNTWRAHALKVAMLVVMLLAATLITHLMNAQSNLDVRMGTVEVLSGVNSAAIERMEKRQIRIEEKIDRLLENR